MSSSDGYLVVGGDSLVGGGLVRALIRRNQRVIASTRRPDSVGEGKVFLDFESESRFMVPAGINYVYIVAAATNYERCETDPLA